jgi:hypothetical protein
VTYGSVRSDLLIMALDDHRPEPERTALRRAANYMRELEKHCEYWERSAATQTRLRLDAQARAGRIAKDARR